ncbi:DNA repair protein SWI5 homolog isoform X1 [Erpetoichthys calabaricus]|uniref:DNA repair protein SWI5 homolog isoform X1 n=1 Tax=Erpetoichthys calabaricus TaxID=27687 RepID=UPI002234C3BA|nr:DNA repair protein SWI5 homolog isoform X1 [Erpetoichthys calabaricus]
MASPDETRSTTPCRGRSVHLSRGLLKRTPGVVSRNLHNSFKSPVQSTSVQNSPKEDHVKIQDEIKNLQKRGEELNKQITKLELDNNPGGDNKGFVCGISFGPGRLDCCFLHHLNTFITKCSTEYPPPFATDMEAGNKLHILKRTAFKGISYIRFVKDSCWWWFGVVIFILTFNLNLINI